GYQTGSKPSTLAFPSGAWERDPLSSTIVTSLQLAQVVERLVNRADDGPRDAAARVALLQQQQVLEVRRRLQRPPQAGAEFPGAVVVGVHVVLDQEPGPLGDQPVQGLQRGADVVGRVQPLADVVQQRRQQELLV